MQGFLLPFASMVRPFQAVLVVHTGNELYALFGISGSGRPERRRPGRERWASTALL